MNTFIPQTGGHDLRLDDFVFMQQGYTEAFSGLISALSPDGNCILSGVDETYSFSAFHYTPGYVAFKPNGGQSEVFQFIPPTYIPSGAILPSEGLPIFPGAPARYLKIIQQSAGSPSDPVPYADASNKNVHMLRTMTMKFYDASTDTPGVDGIIYSGTTGEYATAPAFGPINWVNTNRRGIVEEFYPFPAGEENILFDANGLGMYRMRGYAICNGKAHNIPNFVSNPFVTPDLRGKFTIMPSALVGSTITTLSGPAVAAGAFDVTTGFWSGSLTPGTVLGIASYGLTQANLPNCNFPVTENTHTHDLPNLSHSHGVVARLQSHGTGVGNTFWAVALGNADVGGDGPDAGEGSFGTLRDPSGATKIIPGETAAGISSWPFSPGTYDGGDSTNPSGNQDGAFGPNRGFVRFINPNPANTPTSTANITAGTKVTSGGGVSGSSLGDPGLYTLNIPPAYAMIKICRLW